MRYQHVKPRAEQHLVRWYLHQHQGLTQPGGKLGMAELVSPLQQWLQANASGWQFGTDEWGCGNTGDDPEAVLELPTAAAAEGFLAAAAPVQAAWAAADRERMPWQLLLLAPGGEERELTRAHELHRLKFQGEVEVQRLVQPLQRGMHDRRQWLLPVRYAVDSYPESVPLEYSLGSLRVHRRLPEAPADALLQGLRPIAGPGASVPVKGL